MKAISLTILAAVVIFPTSVIAKPERSAAQVAAFKRDNPCPANGARSGACRGYVVDHVKPLCAGGRDHPANMQWQSVEDAKAKDKLERKECARRRDK